MKCLFPNHTIYKIVFLSVNITSNNKTTECSLRFLCGSFDTKIFPGGSDSKESPAVQDTQVWSLGWEDPWIGIPWRREWLPTPVLLPGGFHGQRSLVGYSSWGCKESDMTEWLTLSLSHFSHIPQGMYGQIFVFESLSTNITKQKTES